MVTCTFVRLYTVFGSPQTQQGFKVEGVGHDMIIDNILGVATLFHLGRDNFFGAFPTSEEWEVSGTGSLLSEL